MQREYARLGTGAGLSREIDATYQSLIDELERRGK
jgi:hypothetical protein